MDVKKEAIIQEAEEPAEVLPGKKADKKYGRKPANKKKLIRNCIIIAVVVAVALGAFFVFSKKKNDGATTVISASAVTRGDITVSLTGSGMIEALESYDVVAMVQGDVLSAPFEEGQIVNEDDVLYIFDSEDAQQSLQTQQNNYNNQRISYESEQKKWEKFTVKAPADGYVKDIAANLRVGDEIANGARLATVNGANVDVTVPFAASAANTIAVGDTAQLSSSKYMTNDIYGTVTEVDRVYGGSFNVRISFVNPGQLEENDVFGAMVDGIASTGTGTCRVAHAVEAEIKGEIAQIHVRNGDYVTKGTVLFTLDDEDTKNGLLQSQNNFANSGISLQKSYDALENYTVKSPITGTVIQKNYKAGDTIGMSSNSAVLATIADISKMTFTINVDELDIAKVALGQKVSVTADAIENKVFMGEITKIIQQGSGTSGVTTYPVEVTIAEPGELKIGMNVTGTIHVSSAENVLRVPLEAVSMRGGKTYVQVLKEGVRKSVFGDAAAESKSGAKTDKKPAHTFKDEDFEEREVTLGASNDSMIEVLSGVQEGEFVKTVRVMNTNTNSGFGAMMPSGGMGGMGGGMPSGGMGGMNGGMRGGMSGGR